MNIVNKVTVSFDLSPVRSLFALAHKVKGLPDSSPTLSNLVVCLIFSIESQLQEGRYEHALEETSSAQATLERVLRQHFLHMGVYFSREVLAEMRSHRHSDTFYLDKIEKKVEELERGLQEEKADFDKLLPLHLEVKEMISREKVFPLRRFWGA